MDTGCHAIGAGAASRRSPRKLSDPGSLFGLALGDALVRTRRERSRIARIA